MYGADECQATDLQRLVDLLPSGLGCIQGIDKLDVVQQAASGTGQQLQNLILQISLPQHTLDLAHIGHLPDQGRQVSRSGHSTVRQQVRDLSVSIISL